MKTFGLWTVLGLLLIAGLALLPRTVSTATAGEPAAGAGPVLVELFTSQGCSSCPPADRLLTQLGDDPRLAGRVIPLSYHVDYWNYIGWKDPFSSADWSGRQNRYSTAFRLGRLYTPQLVVNGKSECVGSEEGEVRRRIDDALRTPAAGRVTLKLDPTGGPQLKVSVAAGLNPGAKAGHDLDVMVALYQKNLSTPVGRGENAHRTLRNDYVVRQLVKAFVLPAAGATKSGEVALAIDPSWKRADLGVAAFLQDPTTMAIQGSAAENLTAR